MPFHIEYTESADEKLKVAQPASSEENGASSSGASSVPTQPRFISAFRGRTVQGLQVDLPEGYTGVVLRSEDDGTAKGNGIKSKGKGLVNSKGKGKQQEEKRFTRRSARSRISEDEEMDVDHEEEGDEEDKGPESTLNLTPSSQFKSFVLWHPDIPVDTGKDEYMSSMSEWIRISSVFTAWTSRQIILFTMWTLFECFFVTGYRIWTHNDDSFGF
ncbi:hypothetical protein BT96DRAFT_977347 [Gymnopus androsaceus JB14]|uniref:Uncharacterized protein n=1 Tax=Gymnopus androsaceus JB14 TaxID=1447944 RepID=A0A6A4HII4_9AGAR|nr:hypothetical protein BT96DRAFT_977347 [Gymnopus androsaceus JB14]